MKNDARRLGVLVSLVTLALTACGGGTTTPPTPNPPSTNVFAPENAWQGDAPDGAQLVTKEEFERRVTSGELALVSPKTLEEQRAAAVRQFAQDRAALERLPDSARTPAIRWLLSQAASGVDPLAQPQFTFDPRVGGNQGKATLLSLAESARHAVMMLQATGDADATLSAYRAAYDTLPAGLLADLPPPDRLRGRPLGEVVAARNALEQLLATADLDASRPEGRVNRQNAALDPLVVPGGPTQPGQGSDGAPCGPRAVSGIYENFWWPLKNFTTPVRSQGFRGTCWAFAGVAALESRELVVNDRNVNISEQFTVQRAKLEWARDDFNDGGGLGFLQTALDTKTTLPPETYWTYNPAWGRPSYAFQDKDDPKTPNVNENVVGTPASYKGACKDYAPDGTCSETAHESPVVCVKVPVFGTFCGYGSPANGANGVAGSAYKSLWSDYHDANKPTPTFPLATAKQLLNSGVALIARLQVNDTFTPAANGFLTDYSKAFGGGGHFVLVTGFVSNATLDKRLPNAPDGAGGGYFIVKNSWGCGAADGGFYYVPVDYLKKYFTDLLYLDMGTKRSERWTEEVEEGSQVTIVTPKVAQVFKADQPYALSGSVRRLSDNQLLNCDLLVWRTDAAADGFKFGCKPVFTFKTPGARKVRATYLPQAKFAFAEVGVTVVANTAPVASITAPSDGATFSEDAVITLTGRVRDLEDDTLLYAWRLVTNPGTPQETRKDIPGAAGTVSGVLTNPSGDGFKALPVHTFKLSSLGAVCEATQRTYRLELYVADGFLTPNTKDTTVTRTLKKSTCKP